MIKAILGQYEIDRRKPERTVTFHIHDETDQAVDLSECTVTVEYLTNGESVRLSITTTPDPDQVVNKGKATYKFTPDNPPTPGGIELARFRLDRAGSMLWTRSHKMMVI